MPARRAPRAPARAPAQAPALSPAPVGDDLVLLAEFGRAHGLNGEVRLKSYTGDPLAVAGYGPLVGGDGRAYMLGAARPAPGGAPDLLIVRVAGVADRAAAERLNRLALHCPRARLSAPEDEDEFLAADLVGLSVVDGAGTLLGTVAAVPNYGGGDLLEIRPAQGGPSALLPFTRAFAPEIDVPGRRIVIDPPADLFAPAAPRPADAPD